MSHGPHRYIMKKTYIPRSSFCPGLAETKNVVVVYAKVLNAELSIFQYIHSFVQLVTSLMM